MAAVAKAVPKNIGVLKMPNEYEPDRLPSFERIMLPLACQGNSIWAVPVINKGYASQ